MANKLYYKQLFNEAIRMSKIPRYKLPRKKKKAFIKAFSREDYIYFLLRKQIEYDLQTDAQQLREVICNALRPACYGLKRTFLQIHQALSNYGDRMAEELKKSMPEYYAQVIPEDEGIKIEIKDPFAVFCEEIIWGEREAPSSMKIERRFTETK